MTEKFTKLMDTAARGRAADTRLPMLMRVELACVQQANNFGHAAFDPDELAAIVHGSDTKLTERRLRTVRESVGKLVKIGLAAPGSSVACVVLDHDVYRRDRGKGGYEHLCTIRSHRKLRQATWTLAGRWRTADGGEQQPEADARQEPGAVVPPARPAHPAPAESGSPETVHRCSDDPWDPKGVCMHCKQPVTVPAAA